ncbi:MAG TPA: M23 family metallopeptidase [Terracidiphilus sp.]|jgi:murein DD-endopeptidase MepM/ murein hydrolase activator NlpD
MLRKRYYILFVARDEDGQLRKIPLPLKYVYGFVAAAIVGAFTIVGLAGSYTRMVLKTESFNQVREDRETLRQNYQRMAAIAHNRSVQVASLGALANEVSALYGLRQSKLQAAEDAKPVADGHAASAPVVSAPSDDANPQQIANSIDMFYALRSEAMSGAVSRALESGLTSNFTGDWTELADAPSMWPVEGRVASSFGERQDPINGEGAFHTGVDIDAPYGTPVRAAGDGEVTGAQMGAGYGREITLDHGHDVMTLYGHLSAAAVVPGQHVTRGQVIGYVGESGRATGPHLHYEVRLHDVPVNPYKYLRVTYEQATNLVDGAAAGQ